MTPQNGVCTKPASGTLRLPIIISINNVKLFMNRNVVTEMSPHRNGQIETSCSFQTFPNFCGQICRL